MKKVLFGVEARSSIKKGMDAVADAVKVTLGSRGRTVIIADEFKLHLTKDGVTVARSVEVEDVLENIGASMIKEVANKTVMVAGDGTTTACILAQAIVSEGMKYIVSGTNPMLVKKGIDDAVKQVVKNIQAKAVTVDDEMNILKTVAIISANGDEEIAQLIHGAYKQIGKEGVLVVEESESVNTYVDVIDGMQFERGYVSTHFINEPKKMVSELKNPYILLSGMKLSKMPDQFLKLMEKIAREGRPLVVIADDIEGDLLTGLIVNHQRGALKSVAVKCPYSGIQQDEFLKDLSMLTGASVIEEGTGGWKIGDAFTALGTCESIIVHRDKTVIVGKGGDAEKLKTHIAGIEELKNTTQHDSEKKYLEQRIARLKGGVGVFFVGAATDIEMKEKKDRADDAVQAVKCAIEEGVIHGGGTAYLLESEAIDINKIVGENISSGEVSGWNIIKEALQEPIKQLLYNAGIENNSRILNNIEEKKAVYNVTLAEYTPFTDNTILDPVKVVRVALEHAASIAGMFLTTECLVYNRSELKLNDQQQ